MGQTNSQSRRVTRKPLVGIIMGSASDLPVMEKAREALTVFGVPCEVKVVSAHRTPDQMIAYARDARKRGLRVIIAGAGGAAHLPGMVASVTTLPVIGVPVKSANSLDGWDSLLSIAQMPEGIPVATVAVNGAANAGILAVQILSLSCPGLPGALTAHKKRLAEKIRLQNAKLSCGTAA